jgi:cytochrome c biogenesis protein
MPKVKNVVWRFFASVKLALISLIILAVTSIIGTLIKQGQAPSYYVQEYGPSLARLFEILEFSDMYSSWWFVTLLCLFAVNLVVCSIERLPGVWRMVVLDNLSIDPQKLDRMSFTHRTSINLPAAIAAERLQRFLLHAGWKKARRLDREGEGSILLFAQKGPWTRLGVYVVHLSVLVILIGAMTGAIFGFQAYVFLPEGRATDSVFLQGSREPVPLGFKLQCDRFERTFYANGTIKQFRADLTVSDPERETPYRKSIIVNDPLTYRGLTFYQADSFPLEEFFVLIRDRTTGREQAFRVAPEQDAVSQVTETSFRIEELKTTEDGTVKQARISFAADTTTEPSVFWIENQGTVNLRQSGKEFNISFRQYYTTLLLVTKDPGLFIVYFGCLLMIVGLAICFFLTHQRIWVRISPGATAQESLTMLSGDSNKNKSAFEQRFQELINLLE